MIRPLAALTRQAQDFFHTYLVGVCRWEDVEFTARERNVNPPPETWVRNKRGRRIRPEQLEGKFHNVLRMQFGVWDLIVEGPTEHPPLGWVKLKGFDTVEGPLDPATWKKMAEHIKENHKELDNEHPIVWSS